MKGETTQGNTESTIDAELGDLPLEIEYEEDFDSEIVQIGQNSGVSDYEPTVSGEEWIARALATVRVREIVSLIAHGPEKEEQDRTTKAKTRFLEVLRQNMGTYSIACEKTGIARDTYYRWLKIDPQFRSACAAVETERDDIVRDEIYALIQKHDAPTIRFYAERKLPEFKSKSSLEVFTGNKTFTELLYDEAEKEIAKEEKQQYAEPENK